MTNSFNTLVAERDRLAASINADEESEARRAADDARSALDAYRSSPAYRLVNAGSSPEESQLSDQVVATRQRLTSLETKRERAEKRISEIDALLRAPQQMAETAAELKSAKAALQESRAQLQQLDRIAAELKAEISALEEQFGIALKSYGAADLAARIGGKTLNPPKEFATLENDLRSRRAALEATQSAQDNAAAQAKLCIEKHALAVKRFQRAQRGMVDRRFRERLPEIVELHAMLVATESEFAYIFAGEPDPDLLQGAQDALRKEIAAV